MVVRGLVVLLLPLAIFIAGIVLLFRGLRGKLIDMHPLCRKCGFDLFGLPKDSTRCSECGAELNHKRAIRVGHRARRWGMIVAGIWLMAPLLLLAGIIGRQVALHANPWELKPAWWLAWDAEGSNAQARSRALIELADRVRLRRLSDGQIGQLVTRAMQIQGDAKHTWEPGWGEIVEQARAAGKVQDSLWQQYVKQGIAYRFEVRPRVRRGAPIPMDLWAGQARLSSRSVIWVNYVVPRLELGGRPCRALGKSGGMTMNSNGGAGTGWVVEPDDPAAAQLKPGPQTARIVLDVVAFDGYQPETTKASPTVKTLQLTYQASWELVDSPTVRVVKDDSLRPAVEQSLSAVRRASGSSDRAWVSIEVKSRGAPVALAFELFVHAGGKEYPAGSVAFPANTAYASGASARIPDLKGDPFDLVLRSSLKVAERRVNQTEMWEGEVVIKGVTWEK
jgi:hypothetical protein